MLAFIPIYYVLAMKRVFNRSWSGTLARAAALTLVYGASLAITVGAAFAYTMLEA